MFAAGILITFVGYSVGSWGMVLLHGWNIPFLQWINPLHPYTYPSSGTPEPIPDTLILPGAAAGNAPAGPPGQGTYAQSVAGEGGNPIQQTGGTVAGGHGR